MTVPQLFTPITSKNGDDQSIVIGNAEPDISNDMAVLFQQDSQINLVTNSNTQSRQRGGGRRSPSRHVSEIAANIQPTVQYVNSQPTMMEEEDDFEDKQRPYGGENFSPNFMTMDDYNSGKKIKKKSFKGKHSRRMSQNMEDCPKDLRIQGGGTFGQNKQSFGDRMPNAPNSYKHNQSQAQGQAQPPSIDIAALDELEDLRKHFRSTKSDQVLKPVSDRNTPTNQSLKPGSKRKAYASKLKGRINNNNTSTLSHNQSDLEPKIPYYLRRD